MANPLEAELPDGNFDVSRKILPGCDLTCHSHRDDSVRDWQWLGLDGITQDNGHGLADGMPSLGICTVETVG